MLGRKGQSQVAGKPMQGAAAWVQVHLAPPRVRCPSRPKVSSTAPAGQEAPKESKVVRAEDEAVLVSFSVAGCVVHVGGLFGQQA